jgi:hypothetical protein
MLAVPTAPSPIHNRPSHRRTLTTLNASAGSVSTSTPHVTQVRRSQLSSLLFLPGEAGVLAIFEETCEMDELHEHG